MKFGALLRSTASELPEITCLFDTYKQLKKKLKRLPEKNQVGAAAEDAAQRQALTVEESEFVETIDGSLANLNNMFIEKEEEAVIRLEQLQAAAVSAKDDEQRRSVYRDLVDFHGEVLLLVHWSVLAYTATVKILKKHHKRTGLLLRAPQLQNLLSQPFCSTELMTQLAHKAEECVQELVGLLASSATSPDATSVLDDALQPPRSTTAGPACNSAPTIVQLLPPASTSCATLQPVGMEVVVEQAQQPEPPQQQQQGSGAVAAAPVDTDMFRTAGQDQVQLGGNSVQQQQPASGVSASGGGAGGDGGHSQQVHQAAGAPSTDTTDISLSHDDDDDDSDHADADSDHIAGAVLDTRAMANAVSGLVDAARKRMRRAHQAAAVADLAGRQDDSANHQTTGAGCHSSDMAENSAAGSVQGDGHHLGSVAAGGWSSGQQGMLRRTQVALDTWSQLRTTASTPSTVLPPDAQPGMQQPQHSLSACQHQQQAASVGFKRPRSETSETAIASS